MCGIAGFGSFNINYENKNDYWNNILKNMRISIRHRGEDDVGEYLAPHVGLSHTRLSIRDLSFGAQPIIRTVNGRKYVIVYNGEIYNADEIKKDLLKLGYDFQTTTDTEVILYAYIHYGRDFVNMLNGIFAFAVWDEFKQELILYRDYFGIKPLFYTIQNETIVFGSEIKALFCYPGITPQVDINSFREIFGIGPARTDGNGVFKGIHDIKAGHYGVFGKDGFSEVCYWELTAKEHTDSLEQTVQKVSYLVRDAITRQMVSDVPVCTFLSGGIDSSIVTAVAAGIMEKNNAVLNTFSFDFKLNDVYFKSNSFQPEQDRTYVKKMLETINTNHTFLECDEADLISLLYAALDAKDLPGMADVDASLLYFCSLVKKQNKVVLTGECADEIFGGYPWFYRDELVMTNTFPWSKDMSARTILLKDSFIKELQLEDYVNEVYKASVSKTPHTSGETGAEYRRREISYLNIKWFMQTLLDRMDRTSMYSGLEARVPFADRRIVEYLYNVPWDMKYRNGEEKWLLRESCKDLLPPDILRRKKSPYPKTYNPHYEQLLSKHLNDILENKSAPVNRYIDKAKAQEFLKAPFEYGKPWFGQLMAAPQLMAYIIQVNGWLENFGCN